MKDRVNMLPQRLEQPLGNHLAVVKALHQPELAQGCDDVWLPFALARKSPNSPHEPGWHYVFPAAGLSVDPRSGAYYAIIWTRSVCSATSSVLLGRQVS